MYNLQLIVWKHYEVFVLMSRQCVYQVIVDDLTVTGDALCRDQVWVDETHRFFPYFAFIDHVPKY